MGDISTLEELILEDNLLGGPLPQNLGRLTHLKRLPLNKVLLVRPCTIIVDKQHHKIMPCAYDDAMRRAWEQWDKKHFSENHYLTEFAEKQVIDYEDSFIHYVKKHFFIRLISCVFRII